MMNKKIKPKEKEEEKAEPEKSQKTKITSLLRKDFFKMWSH